MKHTPEHNHFADGIFRGVGSYDPCKRCIMEHAAPDMLEALRETLDSLMNMTTEDFGIGADKILRDRLTAVIKKAEGE